MSIIHTSNLLTINFKILGLVIFLLFSAAKINAQICRGALGDPVINIDFGRGTSGIGPAITETNYRYKNGNPEDGEYTIVKTTAGLNPGWHQSIVNRTPNDPNGYFMVVNADYNKGVFYQKSINVCPNTTYEFAAYIINILINPGIRPNIKFSIEYNSTSVEILTNDIREGGPSDWIKYGTVFTTPANVTSVTLKMTNENPGGNGNDLALDDITFRPCGPEIKPIINNNVVSVADLCEGQNSSINLSAQVSNAYTNPAYQWQEKSTGAWKDIPGENRIQTRIDFTNARLGTYPYRLLVAEQQNINSPSCRVASSDFIINVVAYPNPTASVGGTLCIGSDVQLQVNGSTNETFKWTGPNAYSSTQQNPILSNVNSNTSGLYTVEVKNSAGCVKTSQINIQVLPQVNAKINMANTAICAGNNVQLIATGGTSYRWLPVEGLSDPTIANPVATPLQNTNYTVTVSNGNCSATASVQVNVLKLAVADAGEDKKLLFGQSAALNGKAAGDNITYVWSPTTYLDDPTKLNPITSPPKDITYTLTVKSGCNESVDEVFVKVYPKIEIPNTFTPNGDGINDKWNIPAAEAFPDPQLKVFNREGQIIYESKGPFKAWDGKFKGNDLPTATYYYTLYLNDDFKPFTGWVFLTR